MLRIAFLGGLIASVGCVSPCHKACSLAFAPESAEVPLAARNRVHVTILNGNEPFSGESIDKIRTALNDAGYAKVSVGGLLFGPYFEAKIRTLHKDEPDARFVVIGYGFGAGMADRIAAKLHGEGVPIKAVFAIAPRTLPGEGVPSQTLHRIEIAETAPETVLAAVQQIGASVSVDSTVFVAALPLIDDPAPLPQTPTVKTPPLPEAKPVPGTLTGREK